MRLERWDEIDMKNARIGLLLAGAALLASCAMNEGSPGAPNALNASSPVAAASQAKKP